jgi:hypothetical protein
VSSKRHWIHFWKSAVLLNVGTPLGLGLLQLYSWVSAVPTAFLVVAAASVGAEMTSHGVNTSEPLRPPLSKRSK